MIEVKPIPAFNDNYIWLIIHQPSRNVAIVDPGDATPVLKAIKAERLTPKAILITHHHADHVGGVRRILEQFDIPVYGPVHEDIPARTHALEEGHSVELADLDTSFTVLNVPGHTSGAIAYYRKGMVFVGDTLFMSGCGRLFEGTAAQMHDSLSKLANLPDDTQIYCAHEYTLANLGFAQAVEPDNQHIKARIAECSALQKDNIPTVPDTLAREKLTNPFLRSQMPDVIQAASQYADQLLTEDVDVFAAVRKWKDNF